MVEPRSPQVRVALYRDFAALLSAALSTADVAALCGTGGVGSLDALADAPAFAAVRGTLYEQGDAEATATALNRAFCSLFLGVNGPQAMVPPYESAYYGETGALFQEPVAEMQRLLAAHGLAATNGWCEPPDHLATELAPVEHLVQTGADDTALLDRLLGWVPRFAELCAARDPSGFYAGVAALLLGFLTDERNARPATPASPAAEVA